MKTDIISVLRIILTWVLIISIIFEIIFFPSIENIIGCLMVTTTYLIFCKFFFKRRIIIAHPFSFICFLSFFLAHYLPLPGTLIENKPISYGLQIPYVTYFHETLIFIVASIAFKFSYFNVNGKVNIIKKAMIKAQLFNSNEKVLWIMGFIGLFARTYQMIRGNEIEYGDATGKFILGFMYLMYAPILLLFPNLIKINVRHKKIVWGYIGLIFVLGFMSNGRQQMIYPIFTLLLLAFIYITKCGNSLFVHINKLKLVTILVISIYGVNMLSDMSLAMLANRKYRDDIDKIELLKRTTSTLFNESEMEKLRNMSTFTNSSSLESYSAGWTETYINNFMLNRFVNLRVSDQTLFYAEKLGFSNKKMREVLWDKTIAIFPTPIINFMGYELDKKNLEYSPGDMLYYLGSNSRSFILGGFRVTSLAADGLATFGYFCYPIIGVLLFFSFKLMDFFVIKSSSDYHYSTYALINIFSFIGIFRNSIGIINILNYIIRAFWQGCFTYAIIAMSLFFIYKYKENNIKF